MEVFDSGTYRINIAGEDSSIIIDSNESKITGDLMSRSGTKIVDSATSKLYGSLYGNILDMHGNIVYDSVKQTLSVIIKSHNGAMAYDPATQHFYGVMQGSIKDDRGRVSYDSAGGVFNGKFRGTLVDDNERVILDTTTGSIDISFLRADKIDGTIVADVQGNVVGRDSTNVIVDTINHTVSAKLIGNLYSNDRTKIIDYKSKDIYANSINVHKIFSDEDYMTFGNGNEDIYFYPGDAGITIEQTFSNLDMQSDFLKFSSKFKHGNIDSGMLVSHILTEGWVGERYREAGHLYFIADPDSKITNNSETIPTLFGVYVNDGKEQKTFNEMFNNSMTFDHNGILQAPIIQTGTTVPKHAKKGMIIFNDKTGKFQGYTGKKWVDLSNE